MWNSAIAFEGRDIDSETVEALVKIRHVATDAMYMSSTVLGGISARFDIDEISLLKFYTACGQKYASELSDMEMAEVCYTKAAEFGTSAVAASRETPCGSRVLAKALFDLRLGRAECAWERTDSVEAERFVSEARSLLAELPDEHEFLASVEYNFGLFTYQSKETEKALSWLQKSLGTRGSVKNTAMDTVKQAKTARLAGVCFLALQQHEQARTMMEQAEQVAHDPIGAYLLLKLSIVTRADNAVDLLKGTLEDNEANLDICMASVALIGDAQRLSDAADGYRRIFGRFKENVRSRISVIGPRYFETLSALGRINEALQVLETCCAAIPDLAENSEQANKSEEEHQKQISRWAALALSAGAAQADRKDFASAATFLDRSLRLARSLPALVSDGPDESDAVPQASGNIVLENEAAVCRLAASCALCVASAGSSPVMTPPEEAMKASQDTLKIATVISTFQPVEAAILHARRAKELDEHDFASRLLLFRAYLIANKPQAAANEMRNARCEIRSFDAGALAEAACAARDVGSRNAVLAALQCVLKISNGDSLRRTMPPGMSGFYGTVLVAAVNIILDATQARDSSDPTGTSQDCEIDGTGLNESQTLDDVETTDLQTELLHVMKAGLAGLSELGADIVFDDSTAKTEPCLGFLVDVAWNAGRAAGTAGQSKLWASFFDVCHDFSVYRHGTADVLQTRRIARLMTATALIEGKDCTMNEYQEARKRLEESRKLTEELRLLTKTSTVDPILPLLLVLDARCCVGIRSMEYLSQIVELACADTSLRAGVLEQLAAVCCEDLKASSSSAEGDAEYRVQSTNLTCSLLTSAVDRRLSSDEPDLSAIAVTLRELLGMELSRGSSCSRAYIIMSRALGLIKENTSQYPSDERRWLTAVGWDRAQMFARTGQDSEATRWAEAARAIAETDTALSTYVPRLVAFKQTLVSHSA